MFKSEPICVLTAGPTIDGRDISQKVIDDIAETYDVKKYTARINDDHSKWSWKGGSVLTAEARGNELWVEVKPNSHLLRNIENGQLLHTSCEYLEDFASTGKAYLTGLAFTDEPASLGTTQVHLSAQRSEEKALHVCTGQVLNYTEKRSEQSELSKEERTLMNKLKSWFKGEEPEQLSQQQDEDDMSKKTEELLEESIEQNKVLSGQLGQLVTQLASQNKPEEKPNTGGEETAPEENKQVTELKGQVETLSSKVENLTGQIEKFSKLTDEEQRKLAGEGDDEERYL
ncbi:GPO family capsid scaffolding protein [Vibrio splendidus]|uniref:GPO family capsid scaffolding protein n=1 Tax=Vibrio splendidus TaxID=29497 RepID=UPI000C83920B|nr:GPO family capsid scaffolding protein [Vibrio splendidus]PMO24520.1 phage capsid protein [Vibrio splendidus]